MNYEPLLKGSSESTKEGSKYALKHFNLFLTEINLPSSSSLTEAQLCDISVFQRYGDYLYKYEDDGAYMSAGTALQYLSGAKTFARKQFPRNAIWKKVSDDDEFQQWYSDLREELEDRIFRRCLEQGATLQDKSDGIDRECQRDICRALINRNTAEGYFTRVILNITRHACGRAGEAALTTRSSIRWYMNTIHFDWNEKKTNRQTRMPVFCDSEFYESDILHSLACYFITGGNNTKYDPHATSSSSDAE